MTRSLAAVFAFAALFASAVPDAAAINPPTALRERALARQAAEAAAREAAGQVPDTGPRDPSPEQDPPPEPTPVNILVDMLVEIAYRGPQASALSDVMGCAQSGGAPGLQAGMGRAIVSCESDAHGHVSGYQVYLSAEAIAAYNAARGENVQVAGETLGYGTGVPAPGGMPTANFTEITSADVAPALRRLNALREAERRAASRNPRP